MATSLTTHCGNCAKGDFRSMRMFCNLHAEALDEYLSIGLEKTFARGDILFQENGLGSCIFVICTGQVKLSCTSREGRTLILRIAVPGDVLGLAAVISGSTYEVTAEALMPTEVKNIERNDFLSFHQKHSEASLHAAQALSEDYKTAFVDARRLALSGSARGRLAGVLLELGRAAAFRSKLEMRFTMALSHEELGNLIGSSRETVTRTMGRLKKDNLIQVRGSSILIVAPELLEQLSA